MTSSVDEADSLSHLTNYDFLDNKDVGLEQDAHSDIDAERSEFIFNDDEEFEEYAEVEDENESDEEADLFSSICAICDNGGEILCCEGRCLRSFHATAKDGAETHCKSLGLSNYQVQAMQYFLCKNCQHKQHQCFACGKLGSSDKSSGGEVFRCVSATCGYFYHPKCVAKLLYSENEAELVECQKKISAGDSFTCPVHKCLVCKEGENKGVRELQFAVCRRCPTAYHRKCLPRKIKFQDSEDEEGELKRAWNGLLPNNHILIYCLKHNIDRTLRTPIRNHITFPEIEEKTKVQLKRKRLLSEVYLDEKTNISSPLTERASTSWYSIDNETKRRMLTLKCKASSSITLKEVIRSHKVPSTHAVSSKYVVGKTTTLGKVESLVEAIRTALQKSEEGFDVEDVKAVCDPVTLNKIMKWRNKLKVYLAPFLHDIRYTSFGRHFTKVDKLKEIVDILYPYVENGDTIVDFCCGRNDFSCFMKEKLEEIGKSCLFKNYDVIQPKNDFCFERRDWMTIRTKELPTGSRLIIGLSPPFGVRAALANKFIDKALEFRPKLVILIAPEEMERLDKKEDAYDLVWEDNNKFSRKSFYLPGSVDDQMDQWNLKPPILYIWSRPDWSVKHQEIALKEGHISTEEKELHVEEQKNDVEFSANSTNISHVHDCYDDIPELRNECSDESNSICNLPGQKNESESDNQVKIASEEQTESSLASHDMKVNQSRHRDDLNISRDSHVDDLKSKHTRTGDDPSVSPSRHGENIKVNKSREGDSDMDVHISHDRSEKRSLDNLNHRQEKGKKSRSKGEAPRKIRKDGIRFQMHNLNHSRVRSISKSAGSRNLIQDRRSEASRYLPGRGQVEEGIQITTRNSNDLDDIRRRYIQDSEDHVANGSERSSRGSSLVQEYGGIPSSEERFPGNRNYTTSFSRGYCPNEMDPLHRRDIDSRKELLRLYGQQEVNPSELCRLYGGPASDAAQRSMSHLPSQDKGSGNNGLPASSSLFGHTIPASSYGRATSAVQHYTSFGVNTPPMSRTDNFERPRNQYPPAPPLPGFRYDSAAFPPGAPYRRPFQ